MFDKAGIKPAKTWDEWMSNCEALKKAGYTPLALMTGENSWTTNLILASIIGTTDAGNKFMNSQTPPTNFETPEVINALKMVQTMLQKYTTSDAIGALYANAANNFEQGKAAIVANGTWMAPDFADSTKSIPGLDKKVGIAAYPGDGLIAAYDTGYMICSKDKVHQDASWEFLKFLTNAKSQQKRLENDAMMPLTVNIPLSEEYKKNNPLVVDLFSLVSTAKYTYKHFDVLVPSSVVDVFGKYYPQLAANKITAEEMAKKLTEAAAKTK